jgi:hypothetical protein
MKSYDTPDDTIEYSARWNNLRDMGNSHVAKASIAVPILGYLILFQSDLIEFLKMHVSVCKDCSVPWRLHTFYFASCFIAAGAIMYAWRCPPLIKKYAGATDFFEAEKNYFCNPGNLRYLFRLIRRDKGADPEDPDDLESLADGGIALSKEHLTALAGVMGEHYVRQNRNRPTVRIVTFSAYIFGFLILGAAAAITLFQILFQLASKL